MTYAMYSSCNDSGSLVFIIEAAYNLLLTGVQTHIIEPTDMDPVPAAAAKE